MQSSYPDSGWQGFRRAAGWCASCPIGRGRKRFFDPSIRRGYMSSKTIFPDASTGARGWTAVLLAGVVGLAACEPAPDRQVVEEPAAPAATPAPQQAPPPPTATTPGAQQTVQIRITDDTVEVTPTSLRPGNTTFQVTNETSVRYDVDIDGPGPDGEAERLQPGETRTIQMNLQAGTYEVEVESEEGPSREWESRIDVQG